MIPMHVDPAGGKFAKRCCADSPSAVIADAAAG